MLSNPSRFSPAVCLGVAMQLVLGAGTAMAGNTYYVGTANGGVWKMQDPHSPTEEVVFNYGGASMLPIVGDWDSDGDDTAGVYDPATGFFFLRNTNSAGPADVVLTMGTSLPSQGLIPIAGDWNGDGVDTVGIYSQSGGFFFLKNSNSSGDADITFSFGAGGLTPIAGDWNNDGVDTVGLYNPATGAVFLRNTNSPTSGTFTLTFNGASGYPVSGDWNNDGVDTLGLYNPATGAWFLKNSNTSGAADIQFNFSRGGLPVAGENSPPCDSVDFDCDGDVGTDLDIQAFFDCLGGGPCPPPACRNDADFDNDGDTGTDLDIEAFFRVLGGGGC